ncbi:retrovirus-related pol polyprotein from transposon TNT 1-94 [Tanacetum coccineum]
MAEYSQKWHNGTSRTRSIETSDGLAAIQAQLNNLGREIKKVNEKVYAAQVGGGYKAAALGFYQRNNANTSYQELRQSMEETLSKFMSESVKRHEENSNMIKEIRASTDAAERGFGSLPSSIKTNPRDHVKSILTITESDLNPIRRIGSPQYAISTLQKRRFMFESRQMTIPFLSCLNDYYCEERKGSYGPQFSEAYSYEALHIDKSIPQKKKDPGSFTLPCYINNVFFDNALAELGVSISVMPLSTYLNLGLGELAHTKLTVELVDRAVKYLKGIAKNMLVGIGKFVFPVDFIIINMTEDVKVPLILGRPFLSTAHAKIVVFKRKITLRVGDEKIIFKSVKPASSLIKRVYMLSLRERMELDLEARLMGETLVLNRSLNPLYGDHIELNDLNVPLELRRDQVDNLMPTIEEGEVIDEPMIDIIKSRNNESFDEEFYNSIIKDKVEYKGKIIVGAFKNVPIFVRNFSVVTHFVVVENMDGYRDQDMGDIILGEPFYKASCVEARRFDGLITIHNDSDNMTYQMERSHPRFKHLSNAQCNKIKPLLKGVLNLGPEYVRDAKMEDGVNKAGREKV